MMNDADLQALARDVESDRSERKESLTAADKIKQAICAFANDLPNHNLPGVVFVGLKDDGSCANFQIDDKVLLKLSNFRSDGNILPFPTMVVEKRVIGGCEVAVVTVEPSLDPPVRLDGRIWIRVGPRRATATSEEERRLVEKRRAGDLPYDRRPVRGATVEKDLDLQLFERTYLPNAVAPEVLAANERTTEQQLASLHFLSPDSIPNVAAILVLGKDPPAWIPGGYVQFVRFDGTEITDPIRNQKEISGPLPEVLRLIDEILEANISVAADVRGSTEAKFADYPIVALQQLARNAVLHRTYENTNAPSRIYWFSDRIEIQSPGGPYGQVNATNFGKPGVTDYRNPLLAEAMKSLGYVQRFGIGIALAMNELEKNGSPPPEFSVEPSAVLVTIKGRV